MPIETIFDTMEYGTAPEDRSIALQWIANHGGLIGPYVNGAFAPARDDLTIRNPATGEKLAGMTLCTKDEVTEAVQSARAAQPDWQKAGGPARARVLYALARLMQKHARLLAVMESLDNGKPIRESRDIDIPLAIRHFYHHAGHAQLMPSALSDRVALGVCGQIIPWNFPLLMLAWKIAPALAMGNTVVLKPAEYTPMTAMIFADICSQAGVPPGVVNIVTGDGSTGAALVDALWTKSPSPAQPRSGGKFKRQRPAVANPSPSNWAENLPILSLMTPISTAPSKGSWMRSGSTKVRSAAPGPLAHS